MSDKLPTFLVIGAMKAGTTSLYHYLREHPQVFLPQLKELHFFVAEKNLGRGLRWYERQFRDADGALAVGEASPDYTRYPEHAGVSARIADLLPRARLVYVLRHPVERIRSHYLHDVARGRERRPIEQALWADEHYLAPSRYATQLEQYLAHFPREQLLLLTSEELRADRPAALRRVHQFIGVDPDQAAPVEAGEFNGIAGKTAPGPLMRAARHVPGAARLRLLAPGAVMTAERLLGSGRRPVDVDAATLTPDVRNRLAAELAPDLDRLREHMGEDYPDWRLT